MARCVANLVSQSCPLNTEEGVESPRAVTHYRDDHLSGLFEDSITCVTLTSTARAFFPCIRLSKARLLAVPRLQFILLPTIVPSTGKLAGWDCTAVESSLLQSVVALKKLWKTVWLSTSLGALGKVSLLLHDRDRAR